MAYLKGECLCHCGQDGKHGQDIAERNQWLHHLIKWSIRTNIVGLFRTRLAKDLGLILVLSLMIGGRRPIANWISSFER